jgi:hypothetical protein
MTSYRNRDLAKIAEAIDVDRALVEQFRNRFEAAATWYRLDRRTPKGVRLAETAKQMRLISNAARKLLRQLEVYDYRNAIDGPGDRTVLHFLASAGDGDEGEIICATEQIGRLVEICNAVDAARKLESHSRQAEIDARHLSRMDNPKGRRGDHAQNVWLAEMMSIYAELTGKRPTISSVGTRPAGPFYRFLKAASAPVECHGERLRLDGVRERVRALLNLSSRPQ